MSNRSPKSRGRVEGQCRAAGTVLRARFSDREPPFIEPEARTSAQQNGIAYENKLQLHLCNTYPFYIPSPWIIFANREDGIRWCQPDGILVNYEEGTITIVECKLKHHARAYYQLTSLYLPVLANMFPRTLWRFRLIEIVRWFDPATPFPGGFQMMENLEVPLTRPIGVHIWNPRRNR